ncbi:MAG TPA: ABC transporter ATP-binding protein [Candidatus Dormibacteraeota bacterium]|nr:ABC transporter ATP-binding protein [Candidatus Dormibacteraeota bacterium]
MQTSPMQESALAFRGVSKRFGSRLAVDHLDLDVGRGEVFGFLGPNGAGKTTTMRMALGLIRPTSGTVAVLGHDVQTEGHRILTRVGPLVETPALYLHLSGRNNLRIFGAELGGVSSARIEALLELTSLVERQHDRVSSYSLGMRQRLGLATALLHDPELLVLDEPANGLDPAGIREVRSLLRQLGDQGKTVFLSSHVLGEVERVCDRVAILRQGQLVYSGPVDQLLGESGYFQVTVDPVETALAWLHEQSWGKSARLEQDGTIVSPSPSGRGRDLNSTLSGAGFIPDAIGPRQRDLEAAFLELTEGEL